MFRRGSRNNLKLGSSRDPSPEPLPPPPEAPMHPDVWNEETAKNVVYFVAPPWEWAMTQIAVSGMTQVQDPLELPSELALANRSGDTTPASTPATRRRRQASRKVRAPSTLKLELLNSRSNGEDDDDDDDGGDIHVKKLRFCMHGTSSALDGLEDKDELVRTLQRCRCDHLNFSPPSVLISWDVTHEECLNVVGKQVPTLPGNTAEKKFAVLKEPMGSQGLGIYFVDGAEEIHKIIEEHRQKVSNESGYLENLIAAKGRIPSWVLQAEVVPALLIKDRRKFHIRTYLVVIERLHHPDLVEMFIFNRHEVRVAGVSVPEDDNAGRDPVAHITNGALSSTTRRLLLHNVEELTSRNIQKKLEIFVAEVFGKHFLPDIARRVNYSAMQEVDPTGKIGKFAVAGLDLMVTEDNQIYLLEVNANPAAPKESTVDESFQEHLKGFMHSLIDLVVGKPAEDFLSVEDILVEEGLAG